MGIRIKVIPRTLHFKQPAGTSRGVYTTRQSWFVEASYDNKPEIKGVGECAPLPDLSCDACDNYMERLGEICRRTEERNNLKTEPGDCGNSVALSLDREALRLYPSMLFGLETALLDLERGGKGVLFDNAFSRGEEGIPINGLVWMGNYDEMLARLEAKMKDGFHCVKLKIGAIDFERELDLVRHIRRAFTKQQIELRVDANGGFAPDCALERLEQLARYDIHSIEQPIRQHQWAQMAHLCRETPIPIALDEELIGVNTKAEKEKLLDTIRPHYIILKPSLHGGMSGSREWIAMAQERGIGSWITSALESNVGLNAVAQFAADVYGDHITMPQGLGTGLLFTDNIPMPLEIRGERLWRQTQRVL